MNILADILSSRIRAEVFRLLFAGPSTELHVREIQRRTGFNDRALRQEFAKLLRWDLVEARRDGNRLYYRARKEHPLYPDIRNLTLKTTGLVDVLKAHLQSDAIETAFVFGSLAQGRERAGSDVDLMVVGSIGLRELTRLLKGAHDVLGREINPHVFTPEEFHRRVTEKEHFVTAVLAEPKMMVKGTLDEPG